MEGGTVTRQRPIPSEPDQRYWRRRANRKVRKERLARNLLRLGLIVLLNGFVLGVLAYSTTRAVHGLTRSGEFALQRIEITGAERTVPEALRGSLAGYVETNLFDLDLEQIGAVVLRDPWIREVKVRRVLPDTVRIGLSERRPTARAIIGGVAHVVDSTGYVIGPAENGPIDHLPALVGLDRVEGDVLAAELRRGVDLLQRLELTSEEFVRGIAELDLSSDRQVTVRTVGQGPALLLDPRRIERNVGAYLELEQEIGRRAGTLEYVDLRWRDRISVMPLARNSHKDSS
jgi:cell division protein FtsQ